MWPEFQCLLGAEPVHCFHLGDHLVRERFSVALVGLSSCNMVPAPAFDLGAAAGAHHLPLSWSIINVPHLQWPPLLVLVDYLVVYLSPQSWEEWTPISTPFFFLEELYLTNHIHHCSEVPRAVPIDQLSVTHLPHCSHGVTITLPLCTNQSSTLG